MNKSLDAVILRYVGYGLLFLLAAYGLFLVRGVLPIFGVALLFAYALEPILRRLEMRGYTRGGAVFYVFLVFLLLFAIMLALFASAWQQLRDLALNLPTYQAQGAALVDQNLARFEQLRLPSNLKKSVIEAVTDLQNRLPANFSLVLRNGVSWVLGSLGSIGITMIVVPILTLYFMLEMNPLRARLLMIVPPSYRRDVTEIGTSINELLGRYVRGQMIVCSLFGALCTVSFHALFFLYGMDYPLVLGLIAGLIYIVPYIGMGTIAIAAGATGYFTADSAPVTCAILAVISCVLLNLVIDYGISPRVLGRGVGLHPLLVIFALLSGAQIGGVLGMILAVPAFASLRVVAIYLFPQLAAPIPQTPPESAIGKVVTSGNSTSEIVQQTQSAEAESPSRSTMLSWFRRAKTRL
ncbi:MAG: hypothetical protein JWN98_767 [Abditibacteriota bacterium]|nr:hypothetical protein [Abditibacteriota bacterium]